MYGFEERSFSPEHVEMGSLRAHERSLFDRVPHFKAMLEHLSVMGESWSLFKNGEFIAAGGVIPSHLGYGELWQVPSSQVGNYQLPYCKALKHYVERFVHQYSRLQTTCIHDDLHNRWMRFLGFEKEGVLKRYGLDGQDYAIHARLR